MASIYEGTYDTEVYLDCAEDILFYVAHEPQL
jgi:hypothetical protein